MMWQRCLIAGLLSFTSLQSRALGQPGGSGDKPAPVVVSPVVEFQHPLGKSFVGSTEPIRRSSIGSAVDGRVEAVYFDEGEELSLSENSSSIPSQNEPFNLVKLKTETITQELNAAQAELKFRKLTLEELGLSIDLEIAHAEQSEMAAQQTQQLEEKQFGRIQSLYERQSGVTKDEFDEAESARAIAVSALIQAQATLKRLKDTRQVRIAQAQAQIEIQEAVVQRLADQLQKHTIRSPFEGYIVSQLAEVGDWVSRGDVVAEVIQIDPIELRVFVPESDLQALQVSLNSQPGSSLDVWVRFDAIKDERFNGRVERIIPQADVRSRTFPVLIRIDNPKDAVVGRRLGSGMLAEVTLPTGTAANRLLVPKDAVNLEDESASVVAVRTASDSPQKVAVKIPVRLGLSMGNYVAITGELTHQDVVVVEGNERIRPGQILEVISEAEYRLPDSTP
jgi:RND family efflux transporter MFP subunit